MSAMPSTTPLETVDREPSVRGVPGLRGTGIVGHVSAIILLLAVVIAAIGPLLAPYGATEISLSNSFVGPTGDHYLGFTGQGADLQSAAAAARGRVAALHWGACRRFTSTSAPRACRPRCTVRARPST